MDAHDSSLFLFHCCVIVIVCVCVCVCVCLTHTHTHTHTEQLLSTLLWVDVQLFLLVLVTKAATDIVVQVVLWAYAGISLGRVTKEWKR